MKGIVNRNKYNFYRLGRKYFSCDTIGFSKILAVGVPIFVDQAIVFVMNLLNVAMISSSGAEAVSAVSMVDSLNFFIVNIFIAIATGGTVVVAQYKGRKDPLNTSKSSSQAIMSSAVLALFLSFVLIVFSGHILDFLFGSADQRVIDYGFIYLIGSCLSYPFFAVNQSVLGILRGIGESKTSLSLSAIINGMYFAGNIIMINVFHMSVFGIAVSILASRVIGSVLSILYLLFKEEELRIRIKDFFTVDWEKQKSIFYIGIPSGIEQLFFNGGKLLTQTFIVSLGTASIAANAIGGAVCGVLYIPGMTFSILIITIVGQCIGAGNHEDAKRMIKRGIIFSSIFSVIFSLAMLPVLPHLLSIYNPTAEVSAIVYPLIILSAVTMPLFWSIGFVTPSGLRAAGDAKFTSYSALTTMWLFRVIFGYILAIPLHLGVFGVFVAMISEWGVRGILFLLRLKGDKWYKHKVI